MSNFHKPIPTTYYGTKYRSRLEARWALFFDKVGFTHQYEPFTIHNNGLSWTPDFAIWEGIEMHHRGKSNNNTLLVEVKPAKPTAEYFEYLKNIRDPTKSDFLVLVGPPDRLITAYSIVNGQEMNDSGEWEKAAVVDSVALLQCPVCSAYYTGVFFPETKEVYDTGPHCFFFNHARIEDVIDDVNNFRFDLEDSQNP